MNIDIEKILSEEVMRPARYIGQELNSVKKDLNAVDLKVALCFPDVYEVGMSHLGLRILYSILNAQDDIACERVFSPWPDFENLLRRRNTSIFSLESRLPLKEFDLIGFSLGYELGYTNVLTVLDLAGIPFRSSERTGLPLIMAGGCVCLNPEPMAEFIDFFCIGEAEDLILKVTDTCKKFKGHGKEELLFRLSKIEGVYVPSFYNVDYNKDGTIGSFSPAREDVSEKIKKQFVKSLSVEQFPVNWITPLAYLIHDRISLEVSRGCPNKCRFCQGRSIYYPYRQRSKEDILNLANKCYQSSGYEEISLFGLSVADHPDINEIVDRLIGIFRTKGVSVSLSSLKIKAKIEEVFHLISQVRKTGLTFAPEAGSQRLRDIIRKDFDINNLFTLAEAAYRSGYRHVKLYFMIGLPAEEKTDLDEILNLSKDISKLRLKFKKYPAGVNLSIANFIPKPHTSFMWQPMLHIDELKERQEYLKKQAKGLRDLRLSFHKVESSFLEGVISSGDRRLSEVILRAYLKGARFDAWDEFFNFDIWLESFKECALEPEFYINRRKNFDEILPWDHLDIGFDKNTLKEDLKKSL